MTMRVIKLFACLLSSLTLFAGCGSKGTDSAAKADAENPALRNSMPAGGMTTTVPGSGRGPNGQGGPGMGTAVGADQQAAEKGGQGGQGGPTQPYRLP